jgi:hypothetical protein
VEWNKIFPPPGPYGQEVGHSCLAPGKRVEGDICECVSECIIEAHKKPDGDREDLIKT